MATYAYNPSSEEQRKVDCRTSLALLRWQVSGEKPKTPKASTCCTHAQTHTHVHSQTCTHIYVQKYACTHICTHTLSLSWIWHHHLQFQASCRCLRIHPPSKGGGYNWIAPQCRGSVSSRVAEGSLANCSVYSAREDTGVREGALWHTPCADSRPRKGTGCKHL